MWLQVTCSQRRNAVQISPPAVPSALEACAGCRLLHPPVGAAGGQQRGCLADSSLSTQPPLQPPQQSGLATNLLSANTAMTHRLSADTLIEKATATQSASPHLRQWFLGTNPAASEQMREGLRRVGDTERSAVSVCVLFLLLV